jgi:hypothetical protein
MLMYLVYSEVLGDIREFRPGIKIAGARALTTRCKPSKRKESFAGGVGRGMRRAARTAREVARMHGTPIYVWENGKVVAKDPIDNAK